MKRSNIKNYALALLAFAGLSSCTDLEIEESDSFISAGFQGLEDPESALTGLLGAVAGQLGDQANTYALREVTTDAQLVPTRGADWGDNGRWRNLHTHEWGLEAADIIGPFDQWNANQLAASQILDARSNASVETMAGAYFVRAYAMWTILDFYGQVPFRDTSLSSSELPTVLSGAAAVDFILADLDNAVAGLPTVAAGSGDALQSPSKAAARFLQAKVLLNRHIYENQLAGGGGTANPADMQAVIGLVDQITADGFAIEQNGYFEIFRNSPDTETIWWTNTGVGNRIFNTMHYNSFSEGGGGWNGFSTLAEYYDLFEGDPNSNDVALDESPMSAQEERRGGVPPSGLPFTGREGTNDENGFETGSNVGNGFLLGAQYNLDGTQTLDRPGDLLFFTRDFVDNDGNSNLINNSEQTGIRVIKYNPRFGAFTAHSIQFRYADAHLMRAEAMMRMGNDPTAMVNELRAARANTPPLGSVGEQELADERARELFTEGWRRNDMIRFGTYLRDWELKAPGEVQNQTRLLFPIPLPQVLANPNLVQNSGY